MPTNLIDIPGDGSPDEALFYLTAVPEDHLYQHILAVGPETARTNRALVDATLDKAEIVGEPVWGDYSVQLTGKEPGEAAIKTKVLGAQQMTLMCVVKMPASVTSNEWPVFLSSATGGGANLGVMLAVQNINGARTFSFAITNGSASSSSSVSIIAAQAGQWCLMMARIDATTVRLYDLTHGQASVVYTFAEGYHHLPSSAPIRFGDHANDTSENSLFDGPTEQSAQGAHGRGLSLVETAPGAQDSEVHLAAFELLDEVIALGCPIDRTVNIAA